MSLVSFRNWLTQYYPPNPSFTEEHVGPQNGRVFMVTGGNTGVGFELVKLLYATGATIYMASRSKVSDHTTNPNAAEAWRCRDILHFCPKLAVVVPSTRPHFPVRERRLTIRTPHCQERAEKAIETVTNTASTLKNPGVVKFLHLDLNNLDVVKSAAASFAQQESKLDVLWNNAALAMPILNFLFLHETKYGGYTELYAGLSPEISLENNGAYVIPWGRIRHDKDCPRKDLLDSMKPKAEGGTGHAAGFWDWCEEQWKPFL
ncbi:hypothetical protein CSUB01_04791 [Colletotrichum sublineola]|uniref:Short-chain dehydrogenase n=1 Tax=Colletotrichum sublineola TaxID=1173701 RepID=A0A066X563_COLSU|nr:hypothetical protein CSUB01_04791 [Colletotrichum sublineola]